MAPANTGKPLQKPNILEFKMWHLKYWFKEEIFGASMYVLIIIPEKFLKVPNCLKFH